MLRRLLAFLRHILARLLEPKGHAMSDTTPPVVDSVTPDITAPKPGDLVTLTVAAHDADARSITLAFDVADAAGNKTPQQVTTTVGDPVSVDPASLVVTDPNNTATANVDPTNPLSIKLQV